MDTTNENCGLPHDRSYYLHRSRDSLSPVCGILKKYNTININIGKVDKAAVGVDGCLTKWIRFFFVIFRHFLGHFWLSISQFAHMCVCVSVCVSLCSLLRYSLNLFLPPIP